VLQSNAEDGSLCSAQSLKDPHSQVQCVPPSPRTSAFYTGSSFLNWHTRKKNKGVRSQVLRWHASHPPMFYCCLVPPLNGLHFYKGKEGKCLLLCTWGKDISGSIVRGNSWSKRPLSSLKTYGHSASLCLSEVGGNFKVFSVTILQFSKAQSWVHSNCLENIWWLILNGICRKS
jgi:hypothetical protein